MFLRNLFFILSVVLQGAHSQFQYIEKKPVIPYEVAGIFANEKNRQLCAFNESMRHAVNSDNAKLYPVVVTPQRTDSYSMWKALCADLSIRPVAVVGPQNPITDGAVREQCAIANVPHIQATWQPLDPDAPDGEDTNNTNFKNLSINFYPNSDEISIALARLLKYYSWETFTILYEDNFGLLRLQKIIASYSDKYSILVRRLDPEASNHKIFKNLASYQESRFILDCHADRIMKYFDEAKSLNKLNEYQHYILVSLDASTVAESLKTLPCNTTWLSLIEFDKATDLGPRVGKWSDPPDDTAVVRQFPLEALIMDDIANHIAKALEFEIEKPQNPICGLNITPWEDGVKMQEELLKTKTMGITGNIEFDDRGRRFNYTLYVNEINGHVRNTIGRWESCNESAIIDAGFDYTNTTNQPVREKKKFRIISRISEPYFMEKKKCQGENCEEDPNPDFKYEGFAVDFVEQIFKTLREEFNETNLSYEFIHDVDKPYGKYDKQKKKWSGMIGDLLDKTADMAVCDFTITEERKKAVDFTVPFMSLGISILFVQEVKVVPGMYSFLNPYTFDVWLLTATAYCAVSLCLYVCARISPADWENPEPCDKDPEELENIWTFKNCAWLTMGSIMTQGCDILPKAFGTRWVCGMWWFFAVIVCQTYIAQLSASMTSALEDEPINDVESLVKQNKILYGAYKDGTTMEFFRTSKDKIYMQVYQNMMARPAVLVDSSEAGVKRVLNGKKNYAFFMESSTIDYKLKRNCDLKKVGTELDSKDYGIALPPNSRYRSLLNRAILKLKENTMLDDIKHKWWNVKNGAKNCETQVSVDDVEGDLEMPNLIGAFVVLLAGLLLSFIITIFEFLNEVRNIVVQEQLSHKEALIQELKASLNFFQLQKPVLKNPSRASSIESSPKSSDKNGKEREKEERNNIL